MVKNMSLESALDEERREILKLLEGPTPQRPPRSLTSAAGLARVSGQDGRTASPLGARSPVRSMLDISDDVPVRSVPAASAPREKEPRPAVRSMLDPTASPPPAPATNSAHTSPLHTPHQPDSALHRSKSDAAAHPPALSGHALRERDRPGAVRPAPSPTSDYQFEMVPNVSIGAVPKRVTQGGKVGSSTSGLDRGRNSIAGTGISSHGASKSPSSQMGRSRSPHSRLNTNSFNLMPTPGTFVGSSGQLFDLGSAYRRLSDVHLARSGGSLSNLPARHGSDDLGVQSGQTVSATGEVRLQKDYYDVGDDEQAVVETSDEDDDSLGSSDEEWGGEGRRGRKRSRKRGHGAGVASDPSGNGVGIESTVGMGRGKGPRKTLSLLAAAEEERQQVSSKYQVRSLLGPPPATPPASEGARMVAKRLGVHPSTSFDQGSSGVPSPMGSDAEADLSDLKRAQRMGINLSAIVSTPESNRVLRNIIRGDFAQMQQEANDGLRRQRTYLVATDLSDEAAHALEWTIGTVLRDGDTLLAMYAVNEETGTGKSGDGENTPVPEDALALKEDVGASTGRTLHAGPTSSLLASMRAVDPASASASPDSRNRSKAEQERFHAAEDISQRCVKLLRKTRLQVRVVIEVVHCKSPKHLITEVIDFIDPTLVVLGSRGRSALKGVLLGSFSNYLVTKSSVPVMVARRRLRKHSKKYKQTNVRLSNNLNMPVKGLAAAKVDELTRY
ncbi:MAG: hypothetical protein M1838_006014 [Thelocarpon superellum]|nr:MAG: hypothetical protein M1838_006014 [Thelocarpon superellum]